MKIIINGQEKDLPQAQNLLGVIQNVRTDCSRVIAEVNGEIVKNAHWNSRVIRDGDKIELVSFVGGG